MNHFYDDTIIIKQVILNSFIIITYAEAELRLLGVQKGVLVAETPDGVVNSIRCPPQVIQNPPPSGSIITVKCIPYIIFYKYFKYYMCYWFDSE